MARPITFLSDYGLDDDFVGVCHAVIARIAPEARVIDLTHGVAAPRRPHRARSSCAARCPTRRPACTSPSSTRRSARSAARVALRCRRGGPHPRRARQRPAVARRRSASAASRGRRRRAARRYRLEPVSATFHGRDIFAPVAAHLAAGAPLADAGDPLDPDEIVALDMPLARAGRRRARAPTRSAFDRFGNVMLDVEHDRARGVGAAARPTGAASTAARRVYATTFADVAAGELLLYEDAYRTLALAVNRGSARDGSASSSTTSCGSACREQPAARHAAAAPARRPTRRTTARASSRRPARRTARSSPPASRPRAAGARAGAGPPRPARALLMSLVLREPPPLLPLAAAVAVAEVVRRPARGSSGPTTCCSAGARSPGSSPRAARRRAGRCSASASTSRCELADLPDELRADGGDARPRAAATSSRSSPSCSARSTRALALTHRRAARRAGAPATRCAGSAVRWAGGSGVAAGIDDDGRLLVELPDGGRVALDAGEVHLGSGGGGGG